MLKRLFLLNFLFICLFVRLQAQVHKGGKRESTSVLHYTIATQDSVEIFAVLDSFIMNFKQPLAEYLPKHLNKVTR